VSDGLIQDLNHICKASKVGMALKSESIPLSDPLIKTYGKARALSFALSGGDDYQLAYTAEHCDKGYCIGEVVEGNQVTVDGAVLDQKGFQHFM
jgi:thiamine-monophosphate kinase